MYKDLEEIPRFIDKMIKSVNKIEMLVNLWRVSRFQSEDSGEYPRGVCRKGVRDNSI